MTKLLLILAGLLFAWSLYLQVEIAIQNKQMDELEKQIELLKEPVKPCPYDYSTMGRMS